MHKYSEVSVKVCKLHGADMLLRSYVSPEELLLTVCCLFTFLKLLRWERAGGGKLINDNKSC